MKNITKIAISALALAGMASADVAGTFSTGYHSNYLYRGVDLGNDLEMFDFSLDFTGDCGCGFTWNSGIWYAATDSAATADELDFYGSISKGLEYGGITGEISLGYIRYTYPQSGGSSPKLGHDGEVFLGLSTEYAGLGLGVTAYFGEEGALDNGTWLELAAGYGHDITSSLSASLDLGLGFAFGNYSTNNLPTAFAGEVDGLALLTATFSLTQVVSEDIAVSVYITNVQSTDDYQSIAGGEDDTNWGASVSYSF